MNCEEANTLSIIEFLSKIGYEPVRVSGNSYWYLSPLRLEKSPSFKVDQILNRWYDHGNAVGGKLVDLGIRLFETDVTQFLRKLEQHNLGSFSFQQHKITTNPDLELKKVKTLENRALLSYLENRRIQLSQAKQFCKEVYYRIGDRNFFAIAFPNDANGFEIRNKYFKACIGTKDITTIQNQEATKTLMFEGFMDFLSGLKELSINLSTSQVIILNSVNQIDKAKIKLKELNASSIETFFDNDEAGVSCFQKLKNDYPQSFDRSSLYKGHKDLNEMAMSKKMISIGLSL